MLLLTPWLALAGENPYLAGEFKVSRVVDGDTIGVEGLGQTIRFVCLDAEECEKGNGAEERTRAIAADYANYLREKTVRDPLAKYSTPVGWEAKKFAEAGSPSDRPCGSSTIPWRARPDTMAGVGIRFRASRWEVGQLQRRMRARRDEPLLR
jgi:endonuclease YncB( thermonuclease family)